MNQYEYELMGDSARTAGLGSGNRAASHGQKKPDTRSTLENVSGYVKAK